MFEFLFKLYSNAYIRVHKLNFTIERKNVGAVQKVCNARRINKIIWIIRICNRDHYFRVTHFIIHVHILLLYYRLFYLQTYIIHNQLKLIKNFHNNDIVSPYKCHTFSQQSRFYILKEYMRKQLFWQTKLFQNFAFKLSLTFSSFPILKRILFW